MFMRHDLVWPSEAGWQHAFQQSVDRECAACLAHWSRDRLPLVVGRQAMNDPDLALGLPAPTDWERRKFALRIPRSCVTRRGQFPVAREVEQLLPARTRADWAGLCDALADLGVDVRVHGSYGWQRLTGMHHLKPDSDVDLLLPVRDASVADAIVSLLETVRWAGPRIDGELLFPGDGAVAWREWLQFRRGFVDRVLIKRLNGVSLESGIDWAQGCAASVAVP